MKPVMEAADPGWLACSFTGRIMITNLLIAIPMVLALSQNSFGQDFSNCQQAFSDAQRLALYGTYFNSSIKGDIDRIQDISTNIEYSLRELRAISNSNDQVAQIGNSISNSLDSGMVPNTQEAYNNNVNTQNILRGALDKYEAKLNAAGLADVVSHLRAALNSAGNTERYAKACENSANTVKAKANQLENQVRAQTQSVRGSINNEVNYLNQSNSHVQWITERLVGRNYWNSHQVDRYSKLGSLERIMDYMGYNSCIK